MRKILITSLFFRIGIFAYYYIGSYLESINYFQRTMDFMGLL